MRLCPGFS